MFASIYLSASSSVTRVQVLSPFEIDGSVDAVISLVNPIPSTPFGTPQKTVISGAASWEALDESIWATTASLALLPAEVATGAKGSAFVQPAQTSRSSKCSHLCENSLMTPKNDFRLMQSPRNSVNNSTPGTAASSSPVPRPFMASFAMLKEEPVSPRTPQLAIWSQPSQVFGRNTAQPQVNLEPDDAGKPEPDPAHHGLTAVDSTSLNRLPAAAEAAASGNSCIAAQSLQSW